MCTTCINFNSVGCSVLGLLETAAYLFQGCLKVLPLFWVIIIVSDIFGS